jgi:phage-related protein
MAARRFRFYSTAAKAPVVKEELLALGAAEAAALVSAMKRFERDESFSREVKSLGIRVGSCLLHEIRVTLDGNEYRVIFAPVSKGGHIVSALTAIHKQQQQLPKRDLDRAKRRLKDWLERGDA